jgi:hypothetical protein
MSIRFYFFEAEDRTNLFIFLSSFCRVAQLFEHSISFTLLVWI